uniref:Uncharacterized protein n=1 Tax=Nelumbo nucifera TaxID=4432 RepID=A0A822YU30_NELNU|nr:TPA_asm: hypothetical protein HUJ06_006253 [Nelumbo nucifera]
MPLPMLTEDTQQSFSILLNHVLDASLSCLWAFDRTKQRTILPRDVAVKILATNCCIAARKLGAGVSLA